MSKKDERPISCSFCGKVEGPSRLIAGPGVYICSECVSACNELLRDEIICPAFLPFAPAVLQQLHKPLFPCIETLPIQNTYNDSVF